MTHADLKISIIGLGHVGTSLARALHHHHIPLYSLIDHNHDHAEQLAHDLGAVNGAETVDNLHRETNFVLICVQDRYLTEVAFQLTNVLFFDYTNATIAHTSGSATSSVLDPVRKLGATVGAMHPIQSFSSNDMPVSAFSDIYWGVEGQPDFQKTARLVIHRMGGHVAEIAAGAKSLYHLACVVSSNMIHPLLQTAEEILGTCGIKPENAKRMLYPLVEGTVANIKAQPEFALTGPVVRGDTETIKKHLDELAYHLPHLVLFYCDMTREIVRYAVKSDTLSTETATEILTLLDSFQTDEPDQDQ